MTKTKEPIAIERAAPSHARTTKEPSNSEKSSQKLQTQQLLSAQEQLALENFEKQLQLVRDRVGSVVRHYSNGFFLTGPGGVSKSYTILEELKRLGANYRLSNSRMTGRGLFNVLSDFPDSIHVLEDVESLLDDSMAIGVLRSALWGQSQGGGYQERNITWDAHNTHLEVLFTGGVILICNTPFTDRPEIQALRTRVPSMQLQPGDNELRAMMRKIAIDGFVHEGHKLEYRECNEVCNYLINESTALHRPLDLRLFINALRDYLQWQEGYAKVHWHDLVAARLRPRLASFKEHVSRVSREEQMQREREIAHEIAAMLEDREDRITAWRERTGKSQAAFYRRLGE